VVVKKPNMQIKYKIAVLLLALVFAGSVNLSAQLSIPTVDPMYTVPIISWDTVYPDLSSILLDNKLNSTAKSFISKDNVYNKYGFFCKQEAKRDKSTGVPVRMRLGTLEQVNQKEYGN